MEHHSVWREGGEGGNVCTMRGKEMRQKVETRRKEEVKVREERKRKKRKKGEDEEGEGEKRSKVEKVSRQWLLVHVY